MACSILLSMATTLAPDELQDKETGVNTSAAAVRRDEENPPLKRNVGQSASGTFYKTRRNPTDAEELGIFIYFFTYCRA